MVAGRREWIRKSLQHTDIGVVDAAGLAVQQFGRAVHGGAECDPDGLVPEADPEQRGALAAAHARTRPIDAPARSGVPGPGLSSTPSNCVGDGGLVGEPCVVVAPHLGLDAQLAEVLHQVEHEAVVVVDDQDPHRARLPPGYPATAQ